MKVQETGEDARSQTSRTVSLSELRIVLLGTRHAGKSSAGNTILGCEEFEMKRTAQCVKRQGEVAGRRITVVEAPGWFEYRTLEEGSEFCKQEIVLSVTKCPPGPHCLLLVINLGYYFTWHYRTEFEKHLKLLTERVLSHTMVLFTFGDRLGNKPIEQHLERQGKIKQWLVEKCGNRYHVLNNMNRSDTTQVTELLEKIEKMVAANSGGYFEIDRRILQEVEEKRRADVERAKTRRMKVQKQREDIRAKMGVKHHPSDLRLVLLGDTLSGKEFSSNVIMGRREFKLKETDHSLMTRGRVAGRHITVVEAPGWRNLGVEKSTKLVKEQMSLSVTLCPPGPHCLLLVIRVDSIFKSKQRKALEGHLKLFPETVWNHTMVLFSFGEYLGDTTIEQYIESEGKDLQWLVEKCGNRYHVLNIWNKDKDTQVTELLEKIEEMVAANSGCCYVINKKILQEVEEKRRQQKDMQAKQVTSVLRIGLQGTPVEQFIESKGKDLQWLVEKCGNRYHVLNNMNRSDTTTELLEKIEEMVAANSGHCFEMGRKIVQEDEETSKEDAEKSHNQKTLLGHCEENLWTDAEGFVPKMREHKTNNYHRFQCPHAGRFQCRLTNLGFKMDGKGEVLYRIDSWDTNLLDGLGQMKPAGPLYDIDCFEGSVNYLYLPHCEILTESQAELAVAHFTDGNLEIIEPLEVTNTHVIIAIEDLSIFGLIFKIFSAGPIDAQVLFFYKPVAGVQNLREMHIHLLPGNVPLTEVKNQNLDFTNIKTSSNCELKPGRKYSPSCDSYKPQPKVVTFKRNHGPNYYPSFVVFVESESITVSLLDESGIQVWEPHQLFLTGCSTGTDLLNMNTVSDAEFVNKYRRILIQKVSSVMEIADCLKSKQMITDEMYSNIQAAKTSQEQMRLLYRALDSGGAAVKVEFYNILREKQPFLVEELKAGHSKA